MESLIKMLTRNVWNESLIGIVNEGAYGFEQRENKGRER